MKNLILSLLSLFTFSLTGFSQTLLLNDDFSSASGTALTAASPAWTQASAGVNTIKIARADSSGFISFTGFTGSGTGNAVLLKNSGQDISRLLSPAQPVGTTVYASFILNTTSSGTGDYFFSFINGGSFGGRVFIKTSGGGYNLGIQVAATAPPAYGSEVYSLNTNYLVVVKYKMITGGSNDIAELFVFPVGSFPSIEPAATATAPLTSELLSSGITGVLLRQGGGAIASTLLIDGIRVSTDWATAVNSNVNASPALSSPVASLISATTATLGATLTSYGWVSSVGNDATVTERGIVWSTSPTPTTANNKVSGGTGINFTVPVTGLPSGTKVYYRGYAINANGTSYTSADGVIFTEPADHVTGFGGTVISSSAVDLNWTPVSDAAGYLILSKVNTDPTGVPSDATSYSAGNTIGDATVRAVVVGGSSSSISITGLPTANLHFQIIPFGYDGSLASTYNYKTDGTIPVTVQSTILGTSDLVETSGFSYPSNVAYQDYQSTDISSSNSVDVFGLTLRDGGSGLDDPDANPTVLTGLSLSVSNPSILRQAALYDGTTELAEVTVSGSPIVFTGFTASAADGATLNLTLKVSYVTTVADNTQNQFTVVDVNSQAGGSGFAASDGSGAISSVTGDNNRIEVTATVLSIVSQPANNSNFYINTAWSPSIVLNSLDNNANLDTDFNSLVTATSNGSGLLSGNSVSASSGVITFSSLSNNTVESVQLSVSSPGLTSVLTNTFNVLAALQQIGNTDTFTNAPTTYDNGTYTYTLTVASVPLNTIAVGFGSTAPVYNGTAGQNSGKYLNFPFTSGRTGNLTIANINTSQYTNLNVTFGYYQASALSAAGVTTIEWSTDGVSYNSINLSSYLPSSSGWSTVSNVPLPSGAITSNLRLRFKVDYSTLTGAIRLDDIILKGSNPLAGEPTSASTDFSVTNLTNISLTANWVNGDGQKRMVIAKNNAPVDAFPVDGTPYTANTAFGSGSQIGSGNFVVYSGTGTSVGLTNLVQGENYQFAVVDYNGSGASSNYLTTSVLTGSQTTINSAFATSSDVIFVPSSESATISSVSNEVSPLTSTQGAQVLQFTVRDGGGSADFDVLPTKVDSVVFTHGTSNQVSDWRVRIKSADLFEGSTHLSSGLIDSAKITFAPVTPLSIADGTSKTFSVRVSLKSEGLSDNQELGFALLSQNISVLSDATSSGLTEITPFETASGNNIISVTASALAFTVEPGSLNKKGIVVSPSPEVRAIDANGNLDVDFTSAIVISSATTLDGSATTSVPATAGVSVFSNLVFSGTGSETVLNANSDGLTQATSSSINVYEVAAEPTVSASVLAFSTIGNQSFKMTFNKGNGTSRLVVARKNQVVNQAPADEQSYTGNSVFGTGTNLGEGNFILSSGSDTSFSVTGLEPDSTYYFEVFEFNGTGLTANYQGSGLTGSQQTLNVAFASLSDATVISETEAESISSIVNTAGPLSSEDGTRIFDLEIRDGGGEADFDSLPTVVDSIIVNASGYNQISDWTNAIQAVSLFDGEGNYLTDAVISSASLTFALPEQLVVPDNGSSILTFRLTLKSTGYSDNQSFGFTVSKSGLIVGESGTSSQTKNFSALTSNISNRVSVDATELHLANQPGATGIGHAISPALVLTATDIHGNLDQDYATTVSVSASTAFGGAAVTVSTPESGSASFPSLLFDAENPNVKLTFSSAGLTDAVSDSFLVYPKSIPAAGEIVINQISGNFNETGTRFIELVNKTDKYYDLSELKLEFYSTSGVSAEEPVVLNGILFPNRFWLLSNSAYVKTGISDSIKSDGNLAVAISSEAQIGLYNISGSSLLDGLGYGNVTVSVATEASAAVALPSGFTLSRTVAGNDTDQNSADFAVEADEVSSIRNSNSYFFGSGSTVANKTYDDIWFGGNATASTGFTVNTRLGLDSGIVSISDGTVLIQNLAIVVDRAGWLDNSVVRNLNGNGAYSLPVGSGTQSYKLVSEISQIPDAGTNLLGTFVTGDPGNAGLLPSGILSYWTGGNWAIETDGDNFTGTHDLTLDVSALSSYIIEGAVENYVILQRSASGSEWQLAGTSFIYSANKITAVGVTGFGEFTIGEIDPESVPVEFTGLTVIEDDMGARLSWSTLTEKNNQGFSIEKQVTGKNWEVIGSVSGKGTTTEKQDYQFIDKLADQACQYRLSQTDFSGKVTLLGTVSFEGIVRKFEVVGNYPNPFNPETIVLFRIPAEMKVKISVYNNLGQLVTVVKNEVMKAGSHEVKIKADNLASGVYFYEVLAGNVNRSVRKMVLLK
ncbi:MAG: T9SS type A sorting domain-containing protein [Bacteroidetes bacterium]|nr:T9SS type A sorting domain-containing protein [Bacteroidota bacterium]